MGPMAHGFAALGEAAQRAVSTIAALAADAGQAPHRLGRAAALLTGDGQLGTLWQVMAPFAGLLLGAVAAALVVNHLLASQRKTLAALRPSSAAQFAWGFVRALMVEAAPVAAYAAVAAGGSFLLFWGTGLVFVGTNTFQMVASTIISTSAVAWLFVAILSVPLAVGRPGLRCVPLDDREAAAVRRFIRQVVTFAAASWIITASLYLTWVGEGLPRLLLILAGLVICAMSLRALARIRFRLSGFGKICHNLAVVSVFGLGATWTIGLFSSGKPPLRPVLLTILILAALPAADGMAALLLERLRRRLIRSGEAPRRIYAPSVDPEDEALAAVDKPLDRSEREAIGLEMARSTGALAGVEQEAIRWALAISAALLLAETWSLDLYLFFRNGRRRCWAASPRPP